MLRNSDLPGLGANCALDVGILRNSRVFLMCSLGIIVPLISCTKSKLTICMSQGSLGYGIVTNNARISGS